MTTFDPFDNINIDQYLIQDIFDHININEYGYAEAAKNDHRNYIIYLIDKGERYGIASVLQIAAENGNIELSKFFIEKLKSTGQNYQITPKTEKLPGIEAGLYYAAINNNKEMIYYLIENGAEYSSWAILGAVHSGDIELVKLFAGMGSYNIDQSLESALKKGNIEIIDFLKTELRNYKIHYITYLEEENKKDGGHSSQRYSEYNLLTNLQKEYLFDKKKWGDDFDPELYQFYEQKIAEYST